MSSLISKTNILEFDGSPIHVSADETIRPLFEFADILDTGESINSVVIVVFELPSMSDVSNTIKSGSESISGTQVVQGFSGFTKDITYKVEIKIVVYYGGAPANKVYEHYATIHCIF